MKITHLLRLTRLVLLGFALTLFSGNALSEEPAHSDIVATATDRGEFNTLVEALQAAGLMETLQGTGPFTVFAPNDEAFAKLPESTLASLLRDKEHLTAILTYHVIPGQIMAADVIGLDEAQTVHGNKLQIRNGSEGVTIDNARVVKTDVIASNGVIHVIDSVLIPK